MNAPESFVKRLDRAFDGRLRVRWSVKAREFRVEQRVGNAVLAPIRIDADRDDLICARDGFDYLLSVRSGDRMPCPTCEWVELKVPVRDFVDIRCPYCASKGLQGRVVAGYWPLDDALITHLQKLDHDLYRPVKERMAELNRRNEMRLEAAEREMSNQVYAAGADHYNDLVGISSFAFTNAACWPANLGPTPVSES